jgi:endonuclease YncB( thermonuclease family)
MGVVLPLRRARWSLLKRRSHPAHRRASPPRFAARRRYAGFFAIAAFIVGAAALSPAPWHKPGVASAMHGVTAIDGDTLRAGSERIRLFGIDAPELRQPCHDPSGREWACGRAAKLRLASLVAGGNVVCKSQGQDRYGRMLGICAAGDVPDVAEVLVQEGYAVDYSRYSNRYSAVAREARAAGRGIWRGSFERPEKWCHRYDR